MVLGTRGVRTSPSGMLRCKLATMDTMCRQVCKASPVLCQVLDGTWVHDMCQGVFCECKVVSVVHSGFKGVLAKSKRQCSMEEKGDSGIESRGKQIQD